MKNLLFIILPYPSHYYASFPLAKKLRSEGNLITYTGTPQFEKIITNEGFRFISFKYVSEYKIKTFNVFLGLLLKSILVKSFLETRRTEFLMNILNVRKLVIESNPNEIFLDEHLSEYYIYYLNLNVKTKILCTKTSTRKTFGIPPMDSDYMPTNSIYSNWKCEILWIFKNIKDQLKKVTYKLAFLDKDENKFLKEYCFENKINLNFILDCKNYFYPNILGLERIILGNRNFDYPWSRALTTESYELNEIYRDEKEFMSKEYHQFLKAIMSDLLISKFLIYFSFGTVTYKDEKRVQILLEKIITIVEKKYDLILVISQGNFIYSNKRLSHPRVFLFSFVPQLHLLSFCDLMITHGGHNSIKECIQKGVKMLVFPHMENNDQPGNAARVQFGGYGLMGNLKKDSIDTITKPINGYNYSVFDQIVK